MSMPDPNPSPGERLAARAAARLQESAPSGGPVAQFDPAAIALILAVLRIALAWIERRRSGGAQQEAAELKTPRWWQPLRVARRLRLLGEVRREVLSTGHLAGPEPCLDAVLDEIHESTDADLDAVGKEVLP